MSNESLPVQPGIITDKLHRIGLQLQTATGETKILSIHEALANIRNTGTFITRDLGDGQFIGEFEGSYPASIDHSHPLKAEVGVSEVFRTFLIYFNEMLVRLYHSYLLPALIRSLVENKPEEDDPIFKDSFTEDGRVHFHNSSIVIYSGESILDLPRERMPLSAYYAEAIEILRDFNPTLTQSDIIGTPLQATTEALNVKALKLQIDALRRARSKILKQHLLDQSSVQQNIETWIAHAPTETTLSKYLNPLRNNQGLYFLLKRLIPQPGDSTQRFLDIQKEKSDIQEKYGYEALRTLESYAQALQSTMQKNPNIVAMINMFDDQEADEEIPRFIGSTQAYYGMSPKTHFAFIQDYLAVLAERLTDSTFLSGALLPDLIRLADKKNDGQTNPIAMIVLSPFRMNATFFAKIEHGKPYISVRISVGTAECDKTECDPAMSNLSEKFDYTKDYKH